MAREEEGKEEAKQSNGLEFPFSTSDKPDVHAVYVDVSSDHCGIARKTEN